MNLKTILKLGMSALLIISTLLFFFTAFDLIGYSYDLDYTEGFIVRDLHDLENEGVLYEKPTAANNFESVKYPPVYYIVTLGASLLTGSYYLAGRVVSLLAISGTAGLILLILHEKKLLDRETVFIPLLSFGSYLSIFSGLTARVDMLGAFFSISGIYLYLKDRDIMSASSFVLAAYTKHIFIVGVIAVTIDYLFQKGKIENIKKSAVERNLDQLLAGNKRIAKLIGLYLSVCVILLISIELYSGHFLANIVGANMGAWQIRWGLITWSNTAFLPVFCLSFYYIYLYRDKLFGSFFILTLILGLIQFTRGGAWVNGMLFPFIGSVICSSLLYARAKTLRKYVAAIIILQSLLFLHAPVVNGNLTEVHKLDERNSVADSEIKLNVQGSTHVEHPSYLWQTQEKFPPEIWAVYERYSSDKLSENNLEDFFKRKNYSTIITYKRLGYLPLSDYLEENYVLKDSIERKSFTLNQQNWKVYRKS